MNKHTWTKVRRHWEILYQPRCCKYCSTAFDNNPYDKLHVDHIKPVSKYPELMYDINNLQALCGECNARKNDKEETQELISMCKAYKGHSRGIELSRQPLSHDEKVSLMRELVENKFKENRA